MSGRRGGGGRGRGGPGPRSRPDDRRSAPPLEVPSVVLLEGRARFLVGEPFFGRGRRVTIGRAPREARAGLLALVSPERGGARATVVRVLGSPDVARDVIEALMVDRGLRRSFPPGVEGAAAAARDRPADIPGRRDLRDLPTFTIDPVTARDFDDAISAEQLDGGRTRIWVHIADVSAYVRPGEAVDREAQRRGTSVYVPGAVEPMLPEALSNDACSLVPGRERLAVTVELEMDGPRTVRASFYRSLIRSDERLDYDRVDRIFAGAEQAERLGPRRSPRRARPPRRSRRAPSAGTALAIESVEPEFAFDERGHVDGGDGERCRRSPPPDRAPDDRRQRGRSPRLLTERGDPALHRVHERPDPASVERLLDQLASLDVPTPPAPEQMIALAGRGVAGEISLHGRRARAPHRPRRARGLDLARAAPLQQARYSPQNLGHAGLGLEHYCHFTSPIRRYPDLVCHRALLSAVGAGRRRRARRAGRGGEWLASASARRW